MDPTGFHMVTCKGESVIHRHDQLRDIIYDYCKAALWSPKKEIALPDSPLIPADIYVPRSKNDRPIAYDVTVPHPHSSQYLNGASAHPDFTNDAAEKKKIRKHGEACKQAKIEFIPLSVEFYGRWSKNGKALFFQIAKAISNRTGRKVGGIVQEIERKLAFSLVKSNALAIQVRTEGGFG